MRNGIALAICGLILGGLPAALHAQDKKTEAPAGEKVDNPLYKHWAQFKPGSFSKIKMNNEAGGMKSEISMTQTLKEVTPEKAVVEVQTVMSINGQENKMPTQKQEVLAKVAKADADKVDNPEGKLKDGTEEIEVAGKKLKTKWIETQNKVGQMTVKAKVWTCEDVPGQLVKVSSQTEGQGEVKSNGILVEFKADKK